MFRVNKQPYCRIIKEECFCLFITCFYSASYDCMAAMFGNHNKHCAGFTAQNFLLHVHACVQCMCVYACPVDEEVTWFVCQLSVPVPVKPVYNNHSRDQMILNLSIGGSLQRCFGITVLATGQPTVVSVDRWSLRQVSLYTVDLVVIGSGCQ